VATQKKGLIDAERALKDQVDRLRLLLQIHDAADIIPVDTPFRDDSRWMTPLRSSVPWRVGRN